MNKKKPPGADSLRAKKIILGIDPGFASVGYGIIKEAGQKLGLVDYGCIRTHSGLDFIERLKEIHNQIQKIIKKYQPDLIGVEELFFAKNVKTAIKVGEARGVILYTIIEAKKPLIEFTPLQVKQAITGYGRADKLQMQKMVKLILNLKEIPKPDDAADALAIAICAAHTKLVN